MIDKAIWFILPLIPIILFLVVRKKIAPWIGLGNLRRTKDKRVSGVAGMIANLIHSAPTSYQIMRVRFLTFAVILLAPEGSGLFMYLLLWATIPKEENTEGET